MQPVTAGVARARGLRSKFEERTQLQHGVGTFVWNGAARMRERAQPRASADFVSVGAQRSSSCSWRSSRTPCTRSARTRASQSALSPARQCSALSHTRARRRREVACYDELGKLAHDFVYVASLCER